MSICLKFCRIIRPFNRTTVQQLFHRYSLAVSIHSMIMSTRKSSRLSANGSTDLEPKTLNGSVKKKSVVAKVKDVVKSVVAPPSRKRKASKNDDTEIVEPERPTTPTKRTKTSDEVLPETPAPATAEVKAMVQSAVTPNSKKRRTRPANPQATNAPLQTPGGSRVIKSYPAELFEGTPRSATVKSDATSTDNLLEQACAHLISVDPKLKTLIEQHPCSVFSPEGLQEEINPFNSLCSSIISQQVSGAAAASIQRKFVSLFEAEGTTTEGFFPTPAQVAAKDITTLRTAGLSQRKAEYIQGLAEKFASGELSAQMLIDAGDEELLEKLIAVRGLGRWSVEMFACFALKRMDIFSTGDLGVQRGLAVYKGRDVSKLKAKGGKWKYMSEQEMLDIANQFVPYRSLFMWYCWRIGDVNVEAMQNS